MRIVLSLAVVAAVSVAGAPVAAADVPAATQPAAAELPWGQAKAGVELSLTVPAAVRAGGKLTAQLAVRNVGTAGVKLPAAKGVSGWLMVFYNRQNSYVTQRVYPAAGLEAGQWPGQLGGDVIVRFPPQEMSGLDIYGPEKRRAVYAAYLLPDRSPAIPAADGKLARKLAAGKAAVRFMLCLPRPGEQPLVVSSNVVELEVLPPSWSALPAATQKEFAAKLIAKFDKDAWAAQSAHGEAVAIGPPIVPYLVEAVRDAKRPGFARLWLATALADIRCDESVAELIRLLDDPSGGVRSVVGYHGPKQHSDKLDAAVIDKIAAGKNADSLAYTLLGFLVFRSRVPDKLLAASFESKDPRVRSTVAAALKNQASDFNVSRLAALLADENQQVRSAAAKALGAMGRPGPAVIGALVRALSAPGEHARQSIAAALSRLTGRNVPYDPQAGEKARAAAIKDWRDWWARQVTKGQDKSK